MTTARSLEAADAARTGAPKARRHYATVVRHLTDVPESAVELARRLDDDVLVHLAAAITDETRRRAVEAGDTDAIIESAFEVGFGRDGVAALPWLEHRYIVCPGSLISKKRGQHLCRFVSVDNTWIWDSFHLIEEVKRSSPGVRDGFRAIALLPIVEAMQLDVVSGRARGGQHQVDHVVSYVVRRGALVEVSQRSVTSTGMA